MEISLPIDLERATRAEIRLGAFRRNIARARELAGPGVKLMGVIKANAYGHGILRMARELVAEGADYLGVAFLEEGLHLRRNGVTAPVLVMGAVSTPQIPRFIQADLDLTLPSAEKARAVSAAAVALGKKARVHLKVDTGMERIGVHWYSAEHFLEEVLALPGLEVAGIFSHFASADEDPDFTREQLARFRSVLDGLERAGRRPPLAHIANSAGLAAFPESRLDMVRPGIMLYGYEPGALRETGVEPVMRLVSRVAYFKVVRAGASVSYGRTWTAPVDTRVATVPAGYGDGYPRALSNAGRVIVRGESRPVVGRVCMDQFMVDLGPGGEAYNGDEVLLFGRKGAAELPLTELAERLGTIPYELLCAVAARVPRVYVEE